jgi:hypothetical protein
MSLSLDEEVRLYTTNAERERFGNRATLFGIVVALDFLERAYVRDAVSATECVHLLLEEGGGAEETMGRDMRRRAPGC